MRKFISPMLHASSRLSKNSKKHTDFLHKSGSSTKLYHINLLPCHALLRNCLNFTQRKKSQHLRIVFRLYSTVHIVSIPWAYQLSKHREHGAINRFAILISVTSVPSLYRWIRSISTLIAYIHLKRAWQRLPQKSMYKFMHASSIRQIT